MNPISSQVQHSQNQLQRIRRTTVHVLQQRIVRLRKDVRRAKKKYKNFNKIHNTNGTVKPDNDTTATASDTGNDSGSGATHAPEQFGPEIIASKDEDIAKLAQVCACVLICTPLAFGGRLQ